ncbi:MAG: GNAT family N-acetyltransferase [Armatimonadetes bacterium]|nr:GNAT family N-acetyltransferase [Armatimonadota bacterium]
MSTSVQVRPAEPGDISTLLNLISGLAEYERLLHQVSGTPELLHDNLFGDRPKAFAAILEEDGVPAGFALWFFNFSTFLCKPGVYLEDLFVLPDKRGKGYGKALISHVAKFAHDHGCARFEWSVLDWNTPSIDFYKSLGAVPMDEWTVFRLSGDDIGHLAHGKP